MFVVANKMDSRLIAVVWGLRRAQIKRDSNIKCELDKLTIMIGKIDDKLNQTDRRPLLLTATFDWFQMFLFFEAEKSRLRYKLENFNCCNLKTRNRLKQVYE